MPDWPSKPLSELVDEKVTYGIVQPGSEVQGGTPVLRVKDIRDGRVALDEPLTVAPEVSAKYPRSQLAGGEVLLTLVGTVGEVAIAPPEVAGWNVARAVGVIRPCADVDARWLKIALQSAAANHLMRTWMTTTVQATLNLRDVANLPVPMPPTKVRQAITEIVSALDDKIELNRRMNETLEATARALFTQVADDMEVGDAAVIDTLPLDEVAEFLNGLALQKYPAEDGAESLSVIKIRELKQGITAQSGRASLDVPSKYIIEDGDLLFSWSGSLEVVRWAEGPGALNQHLFKVTSERFPQWFVHQWLLRHLPHFRMIAAGKATTMGHIQRHHLTEAAVLVPDTESMQRLERQIGPLYERELTNRVESRTLANLRDTLLPKLLSGEIRVGQAERLVEAAT